MYKIIRKQELTPNIKKIVVKAPLVAKKVLPGQFVVIGIDEQAERFPLTVAENNVKRGTICLIFQEVGKSTFRLGAMKAGETIATLLGPLGKPTEIKSCGEVVTVGGGVGIAEVYPITRAFKQAGNRVISIIGTRTKNLLFLEKQMRRLADQFLVTTDDGSYGRRGFVSDALKEVLSAQKVELVYAVGPVPMMRSIAETTRGLGIKTLVSLNPVMVDATGMCGSCRVSIDGKMKFACVDGPEFDAHLVDYDQLQRRLDLFAAQEKRALGNFRHNEKRCIDARANA